MCVLYVYTCKYIFVNDFLPNKKNIYAEQWQETETDDGFRGFSLGGGFRGGGAGVGGWGGAG